MQKSHIYPGSIKLKQKDELIDKRYPLSWTVEWEHYTASNSRKVDRHQKKKQKNKLECYSQNITTKMMIISIS